jgi:hypothetical protein
MNKELSDYDMTFEQLDKKYGGLTYNETTGDYSDKCGYIRRINHSRANGDFMDEMEAGMLMVSINDDAELSMVDLINKYGPLTLTEQDYYVDRNGIIRRILPYTPLVR